MDNRSLEICKKLVEFNSVTYTDSSILEYIEGLLKEKGFTAKILKFKSKDGSRVVKNLFATRGKSDRCLGILGHLDTVPSGNGWSFDPFKATEYGGKLYGRGIVDMKGGAGCVIAALEEIETQNVGNINIFFTCDEEVGSYEGTQALLDWARENAILPTDCLICEPSSKNVICDRIYIGHRGSVNIGVEAFGHQDHSAYINKETANNALEKICNFVNKVSKYDFEDNGVNFEKTIASPTMIEASNLAVNIIPPYAKVNFNVRFSDKFSSLDIVKIFEKLAKEDDLKISYMPSGEPYICNSEKLQKYAIDAIERNLGYKPELSTGGGTSDGRFMIKYCPVIELGMVDATLHQIDEHIEIADCEKLKNVYRDFILNYFN